MKPALPPRRLAVAFAIAASIVTRHAEQSQLVVRKGQNFLQTSTATPQAHPVGPFEFRFESPIAATLNIPGGTSQTLTYSASDSSYVATPTEFSTKASLDATYPNGTYQLATTGNPVVSFALTPESYSTATPQVTNGTWSNGVLVVNPGQATTINFSNFSDYATAGSAGHMQFKITGMTDNVRVQNEIVTKSGFGITVQSTPFTSYTIPAGTLIAGHVYQAQLNFDVVLTTDTTSLPGTALISLFEKQLTFYIGAQGSGTTVGAPAISTQPTDQSAFVGGSAQFTLGVTVGGSSQIDQNTVSVRWYANGTELNIDGTRLSSNGLNLTISNVTAADAGSYVALVTTAGGTVFSSAATLTVTTPTAPVFTLQPSNAAIATGSTVVFNASATQATHYQWQQNGVNISGATNAILVISGATTLNGGTYTAVASNSAGATTSTAATLTVNTVSPTDAARITNLSVRTLSGANDQVLNVGFVVGGNGTSGSKPLLIRVGGPALAQFLPGTMVDPTLTVKPLGSSVVVASNDDWAGDATVAADVVKFSAFPWTDVASKDAAVAASLSGGTYTAIAAGKNNTTGIVLTEIYDGTETSALTAQTPRLVNVSARAQVGTGGGVLIAGFVIGGNTSKTLLIRAIGPTLSAFLAGALADPKLEINLLNGPVIYSNDNWGGSAVLTNVGGQVGAFGISDPNSKDAMLLVTLAPGGYTATVSGVNGTTGIALVEVYEVP